MCMVLTGRLIGLLPFLVHTIHTDMRILIATGLSFPDIGGPATYTKFLVTHLPQQGIECDVVSFRSVRMLPKIIRHLAYFFLLLKKGYRADTLYALDAVSVGIPALCASIILRKKLYLRVPGDYAWEQGQQRFGLNRTLDEYLLEKEKPFMVRFLAFLQRTVANRAVKIIVPSEYMKGVVMKWGVSEEKIFRIYSALNPIVIAESKDALRSRFAYTGFVVVTSARLVPWKGITALVSVVATLHAEGIDIALEIIGEGTEYVHLKKSIEERKAEGYIHLRGAVPKQELSERVSGGDVFVLNTSYEGLSHQLLEVMDIGVPIITTPVGGNVELVSHEREALLVPFNDETALRTALIRMKSDTLLRDTLVRNGKEKVAQFREEVIIPKIVKIIL